MSLPDTRGFRALRSAVVVAVALAVSTGAVVALEHALGLSDASSAYLVAVVLVALTVGTIPALATAVGAFLIYDYLFVHPLHTLLVENADEWLNLLLLLFVGLVVGRLTGLQRERASSAEQREREARALFSISRTLALASTAIEALPDVVATVRAETSFDRVAIALGGPDGGERTAADTAPANAPLEGAAVVEVLHRKPGIVPAEWQRVHYPGARAGADPRAAPSSVTHRVFIESGGRRLGSVWASRPRAAGAPSRDETRVVSAAADQVGQAVERDRLAAEAMRAEVARRADAAKTALLDSVSHDLRTPLAAIRASAGNLADPAMAMTPDEVRDSARVIDAEADRLSVIVTDLLDLSRIEAGALRPDARPFAVDDIVEAAIDRARASGRRRTIVTDVPVDVPPVLVDEVLIGQALVNVLDNAARYAPEASVRIAARVEPDATVLLSIVDDGPGVPDDALPRLFEKFYRVPRSGEGSRRGSGVGLAVVRGMVEAMGGSVVAGATTPHGLTIEIRLPAAAEAPSTPRPTAAVAS